MSTVEYKKPTLPFLFLLVNTGSLATNPTALLPKKKKKKKKKERKILPTLPTNREEREKRSKHTRSRGALRKREENTTIKIHRKPSFILFVVVNVVLNFVAA